jgi:hypothetical protein
VRLGDVFDARGSGRSHGVSRMVQGNRAWDALESAGVGLLLLSIVACAIAGAEGALFVTMLAAWLLFPLLVGFKNTLDAGCAFMLVSLGVVVVVSVARDGLGVLLP